MPDTWYPPTRDEAGDVARFRLLASAVAGRPVDVAALVGGEPAYTDGATIFVPAHETPDRQIALLSVQAALLGAGSLGPGVVDVLRRRPSLVRRYLAVEGHRALSAQEHLLPGRSRLVIDHGMAGAVDTPESSLAVAAGRSALADPPDEFGTILPKVVRSPERPGGGPGAEQPHVPRRDDKAASRELEDEADAGATTTHFLSSPVGGAGAVGRLLKKFFGDSRLGGGGPPGADSPTHWTRRPTGTTGRPALSTAMAPAGGSAFPAPAGRRYPEWDAGRRRYRPDWCTVAEIDPVPEALVPLGSPDPHPLRRALGRLGVELERQHRQPQGDDIDLDAAIEAHVQLAAGSAPEEAVYIDTVRRRRDLSILVLLDVSGSAGESSSTGPPVHVLQTAATMALASALHQLGDRVAVFAFRSQGRSAVHVLPVKRFDEPLGALAVRRLRGFVPGGYTRLGAAVRHGAAVLERDGGTSRRLMVVVSDGFAYDHGYEPAYGEADARRALSEARRHGIGCLCLSVGAHSDPGALRRVFGTAAHAALARVEELPGVVGPLFHSALRSAEAQRRVFLAHEQVRERLDVERTSA